MSNREEFLGYIEDLKRACVEPINVSEGAAQFLEELRNLKPKGSKGGFTDTGRSILGHMQTAGQESYKAKEIAEGLFISGRSVSGAMRKLITDGYAVKLTSEPVTYGLSDAGKEVQI